MSDTLSTYSFLPWLRQGLANNITTGETSDVKLRAGVKVKLTVKPTKAEGSTTSEAEQFVEKDVQLYGPGDIVGIDSKVIVKTEPHNWITNFEPNYLPYIDFYEEDFAWRYTPARPTGERLTPWLTLVVVKEDEFEDGANMKDKPLPFFKLKDGKTTADIFPKPDTLWAWAHVHVNKDLSHGAAPNSANAASVNTEITNVINKNPDEAYSRIICPRKLEANIGYYAFLIPTYETGRLSGLSYDLPTTLLANECAWKNVANNEFPYYHRWYFRTGNVGDFEYLVNLLQPKPADKSMGVRDMDVLHPGSNLPLIDDAGLNGILKLGGALRVPFDSLKEPDKLEVTKYDEWDEHPYPHKFSAAIAKRINLADDYVDSTKNIVAINEAAGNVIEKTVLEAGIEVKKMMGDPDPVISSPLYGRWHALQQRLLKDKADADLPNNKNWVYELNLDPRFRVSAGLGTKVVQKGQEEYMQAAWEQVGKIIEANNKIRLAQMAKEVSGKFYEKHFLPLITEKAFLFSAPVHKRVMYKNLTAHKQVLDSVVPQALTTGTFRRITRPRGSIIKKMAFTEATNANNIIQRVNDGEVIIAPPKVNPAGAINLADVSAEVIPKNIPTAIQNLLKKYKWFVLFPFIILLILAIIILLFFRNAAGFAVLAVAAAIAFWLYNKLKKWNAEIKQAEVVTQESQKPEAVDSYPTSSNFVITEPGSGFSTSLGGTDIEEAKNFKIALKDVFSIVEIKYKAPERKKINFADITTTIVQSLNPAITIPKRTFDTIIIPDRVRANMVETFAPVMVYPEIDLPMYKPLADMSSELFLPNINLIEQNSITLLENNQKFIEAYMVGINHEMSRELLWREYPTDQRGTYFRQFWDVNSFLPPQPVPANLKESLRDIPPIHLWHKTNTPTKPKQNELGQHNHRALASGKTQLVLVIRGELLKKYPTAVVYAHKADWGPETGTKTVSEERVFATLIPAEELNPPTSKIKTPLFEAKIDPDIYFFGFDLDDEEARGKLNPTTITDDSGWFFVLKERPGEPRFGLDIKKSKIINWNNFSWEDLGTPDGANIIFDNSFTPNVEPNLYVPALDQENKPNEDDVQARWSPDTNAAELAYIFYQVPVLVGVHASRMLPK